MKLALRNSLRRIPDGFISDIIVPFAWSRILLLLIAWGGFYLLPLRVSFPEAWQIEADGNRHALSGAVDARVHPLINMWARWDAGWYLDIALHGYHHRVNEPANTAFFPLYPSLIAAIRQIALLPQSAYWFVFIGIALSNASLLIALVYLRRLLLLDYSASITARCLLYLLIFPTSFFFSCVYSEALFLLLSVSAFYYARTRRWFVAGLLASLATLTRSQGVLLAVPLALEYLVQQDLSWRRIRPNILSLGFIPLTLAIYLLTLSLRFGSWTVLFADQASWGRRLMLPWDTLGWIFRPGWLHTTAGHDFVDLGFFLLLAGTGLATWIALPIAYRAYLWISTAFFASWGMLGSVPRFVVVVFPMFLILAIAAERRPSLNITFITGFLGLGAWFFIEYSHWKWVA